MNTTTTETGTITPAEYNELIRITEAIHDLPSTCDTEGPTGEVGRRLSAVIMSIRERNRIAKATATPTAAE